MDEANAMVQQAAMPTTEGTKKVQLLMSAFGLSLGDIVTASGRSISKSQLHRIVRGQRPSATEKRAIAFALSALIRERCDSAFLFDQAEGGGNGLDH
jgi:hypothetical protein